MASVLGVDQYVVFRECCGVFTAAPTAALTRRTGANRSHANAGDCQGKYRLNLQYNEIYTIIPDDKYFIQFYSHYPIKMSYMY